jgi:hypothetical protein
MESTTSIRRLLAGSSFIALLAASNVVLYDGRAYAAGASATGIAFLPSTGIGGGFSNPGDIIVSEHVSGSGYISVAATAVKADVPGTVGGDFTNTGNVLAVAEVQSTGPSIALATAGAVGVFLVTGDSILGSVINSATIQAFASAKATATAHGYAEGHANALGFGVDVAAGDLVGGISNSGNVYATAIVHSTPIIGHVPPPPSATATGVSIHVAGTVMSTPTGLGNSGLIQAIAIDPGEATARGLVVDGGWYEGSLVNSGSVLARADTSAVGGAADATAVQLRGSQGAASFGGGFVNNGTIAAFAHGDNAHAVGVLLRDGAYTDGELENGGMIVAVATGGSLAAATAIKVMDGGSLGGRIFNTGIIATQKNGERTASWQKALRSTSKVLATAP